ncbi:2',5'-phosphodiesterase 12-like [Tubulanus polymorphus]|uniref:2',5'-phosphodiesterase 12-like n=1 Tax=Tubulanus polymorphus TaxID=672921 RepID=UPI003DA4BA6E
MFLLSALRFKQSTCLHVRKLSTYLLKMAPVLSVRSVDQEERLQITFRYGMSEDNTRVYNFDRLKTEPLGTTIERLQLNVEKHVFKKKKKKSQTGNESERRILVELLNADKKVDIEKPNLDAWTSGSQLRIGETVFDVEINMPTVTSTELPEVCLSGFPIVPRIEFEFVDDETPCEINWFREIRDDLDAQAGIKKIKKNPPESACKWSLIGKGEMYVPTDDDLEHRIKMECTPIRGSLRGFPEEMVTKNCVKKGPAKCPFENRHLQTTNILDDKGVRIVSYNLLADLYADSDFSRNMLFPHCPPEYLQIDYRLNLFIKELQGYNADVLCLQEVDRKVFKYNLCPAFHSFTGYFKGKGEIAEGTAIFFRKSKFKLLGCHDIMLRDEFGSNSQFAELRDKIEKCQQLKERFDERNTILQVLVLESVMNPENCVVVATSHLYFHPNADHIRLLQINVCLQHIHAVVHMYRLKDKDPAVIFAGDFNSSINSAVLRYLQNGFICENDPGWLSAGKPEYADGASLKHKLPIVNACGIPKFTNFVPGFCGTLDWIFVDKEQFTLDQVVPLPNAEEILVHSALPNQVFPSDHLALVCDVYWNKR